MAYINEAEPSTLKRTIGRLGLFSATAVVIANIIGAGIFTTTGFQASALNSSFAILLIWCVGGGLALCGALSYGELAAAMPRSGGEYNFLSRLYHPAIGFTSGFISLVAGFSAPIASSAIGFGKYFSILFPVLPPVVYAAVLVVLLTLLHSFEIRTGAGAQNIFTLLKVSLIVFFIGAGFLLAPGHPSLHATATDWHAVLSPAFAVSLIYVSFAYSGWNAAAYITSEVERPERTIPRALVLGTLVVITLYVLLNYVFLSAVPLDALKGKVEVGSIAAISLFGLRGGQLITLLISLALVSSVSAMVMIGPRVTQSMGEDIPFFGRLARRSKTGVPIYALLLQLGIALVFIFTATFDVIITYIGFTLSLFAFLTVAGLFIYRIHPKYAALRATVKYKTPGYPVTPVLFLLLSAWMVYNTVVQNSAVALAGFGTIAAGLLIYFVVRNLGNPTE